MLQEIKKIENESTIAIWEITETAPELLDLLHNKKTYSADLTKLTSDKRKKEWLATRILVEAICGKDKIVAYNEKGKPYLTDHSFHISISHTSNFVALIAHQTREVGIDIEKISDRICHLKERFLHKEELLHIDSTQETTHLLLHWSAKEVLFKMINEENVDFSEHLRIFPFTPQKNGTFFGKEMRTKRQENYNFAYCIKDSFVLVWSVK